MLVRVLGAVSLESAEGHPIALPGRRQPALLAALAARVGQTVSVDRLLDLVWPDDAPANPTAALHSAVFKLRANLARATDRDVVLMRGAGYALDLGPDDLDAAIFLRLVESARDLPPEDCVATLGQALDLWSGSAYGAFADTEIAHGDALRLEELRRVAVERHAEALVAAGRAQEAVAELEPFLAEHPLRDAARITLMEALHAVGRTADALDQFHDHRIHLAEELGLEPSPALRAAQQAVLAEPSASNPVTAPAPLQTMPIRYLRTTGGQLLAYGTVGDGARLVVQLGWISSLDVIASGRDPRSSLLERLTRDLSLTIFDRAGSGLSPGPVANFGLEASIAELSEIIRAVGPPVSLLAMSSAGPIALALAHRRPEWINSLVLFGTFADGPRTFTDERLRELVLELTRHHWGLGSKMLADLYRPGLSDEAAWHLARVLRDSAPPEIATAYLRETFEYDVGDLLPEISAPTLVLHYRSDRLIPFAGGRHIAGGLPEATFLPLEGRVHLPDAADLDTIQVAITSHVRAHAGV